MLWHMHKVYLLKAHFTVTVGKKAGIDLVLIQSFLLYYFQAKFPLEKEGGLYQTKVNQGHQAHSCKLAY